MKNLKKIALTNGKEFEAETWEELVDELRLSTYFADKETRQEYMKGTAQRCWIMSVLSIRCDDAESFLRDLDAAEILKIERGL